MKKTLKNKIYLVGGSFGTHEDREEWVVAAFLTKAKANAFCKRLMQKVYIASSDNDIFLQELQEAGDKVITYVSDTDIEYQVWAVELF